MFVQRQGKWVVGGFRDPGITLVGIMLAARLGIFLPIEEEIAERTNMTRIGIDPPVNQVEMMRGLVDEQSTAIVFFAMPAAEVVRAMISVQYPGKINRQWPPYYTLHHQFAETRIRRGVAVIEAHS